MNLHDKSKEDLIIELQQLKQSNDALELAIQTDRFKFKQVEEALRFSEERYQLLFNKAPLGYQSLDFEGCFIEVNQQWLDTLGYIREEVIGKWFGDFLTPAYQDGFRKRFPIFKERGKIHSEFEMVHKNGTILFIAFEGRVGYDLNGDFKQTHCILQDITENKQIEKGLRDSEEKYRLLHENAGIGIGYYKVDGTIISYNNIAAKNMNGLPEDFNGKSIYEIFSIPIAEFYHERIKKAALSEIPVAYEDEVNLTKSIKYFLSTYTRIVNINGEIEGVQILSQDITERKLAENEILKISHHYQSIIEKAPDGIVLLDAEGNFKYISPAAKKMFGYIQTDDVSGNPAEFTHSDDLQMVVSELAKLIENPDYVPTLKYRFIDKQGNWHWVETTFSNLLANPSVESIVLNFKDITERKLSDSIFKDIIEKNPMSIQILDMEGYPTQVNSAHTKLFGAKPPSDYSVLKDPQLLLLGFDKLFDRIKKGEVVYFPDSYYNVHDVDPSFPDSPSWIKALGFTLNDNNGNPNKIVLMHENITERKNAEALLNDIIENNPMSIQIVDKDGHTLRGNPAFIELFGSVPPPEFSIFEDLKSKSPELENLVLKLKNGEIVQLPDIYFNAHDAVEEAPDIPLWIRALIFPLKDSGGKPERFVFMHENITERKIAEHELIKAKEKAEESEFRLKLAAFSGQLGIWDLNLKNNYMVWDERMFELYGIQHQTVPISFDVWTNGLHQEDKQRAIDECFAALKGERVFNTTFRVIHPNGTILYLKADGLVIRDADNKPIRMIGINKDITNTKLAEKELKHAKENAEENEQRLSAFINSIPDIICYKDGAGKWLLANESDLELFCLKGVDYFGKTDIELSEYTNEIYKNAFINCMVSDEKAWENKTISNGIEIIPTVTGEKRIFEVYKVPSFYSNGERKGLAVIGRDISILYETQENLLIAKEKAQESDRLKSAFLANMSHEIRTPMNGILGFADLLNDPELSGEQQQQYIKIIEKSGARMLNIINDIIDISKIEAGLMNLDIKETNINEQIEYIFTFFKLEVEAKGMQLTFNTKLPKNKALITTDREKLYAILTNLVKNAIKYSKVGNIELGYNLLKTDVAQSVLEFYVKDSGIGISKDRQQAIFERFVQADIEDEMARQGAGLGLTITKSYVEMLGGKIWVESEEGIGSCFYFTLPYIAYNEEITKVSDDLFDSSNSTKNLKILIAEDDETSETLLSILLVTFSKDILKVKNGIDAIEICRQNPDIDLIMMDIRMPLLGGYEATKLIREFNKDVKIIAQTAYGLSGDREKALEAGCNDYISKPIKKNQLKDMIDKYFKK